MNLSDAIRSYLAYRGRQRRSAGTRDLYARQCAAWLEWRAQRGLTPALTGVDLDELRAFFGYLTEEATAGRGPRRGVPGLAPATVRGYYRTIRAFWRWLEHETDSSDRPLLSAAQLRCFRNGRIPLPEEPQRERAALSADDYARLLAGAGASTDAEEAARDETILRLLWETGLRVHELAQLTDDVVDLRKRQARVIGKGGKEAVVFWGAAANLALRRYLRYRRGRPGGPLLRGISSRNNGGAISSNLIRCLVKRLARAVGVTLPTGSPCHCFRHAFARRARLAGLSLHEVGELLRDDTPDVVRRYCGLDEEPRRQLYHRAFGDGAPMPQTMYR